MHGKLSHLQEIPRSEVFILDSNMEVLTRTRRVMDGIYIKGLNMILAYWFKAFRPH